MKTNIRFIPQLSPMSFNAAYELLSYKEEALLQGGNDVVISVTNTIGLNEQQPKSFYSRDIGQADLINPEIVPTPTGKMLTLDSRATGNPLANIGNDAKLVNDNIAFTTYIVVKHINFKEESEHTGIFYATPVKTPHNYGLFNRFLLPQSTIRVKENSPQRTPTIVTLNKHDGSIVSMRAANDEELVIGHAVEESENTLSLFTHHHKKTIHLFGIHQIR
jgi:hypothetical protein